MSSTNVVNFSLRQNKSIERLIVVDGLRRLIDELRLSEVVYVGLGSVWFSDFVLAHRELGIETMFSIEDNSVTFRRAQFNRPYRTVDVIEGASAHVIPELLVRSDLSGRPWIVWLDYDKALNQDRRDELLRLLRTLPPDSVLITTFSARLSSYDSLKERSQTLEKLFGRAVSPGLTHGDLRSEERFMAVLAGSLQRLLLARSLEWARAGGYVPAFSLKYKDGTPMVTVGGVLPRPEHAEIVRRLVEAGEWVGVVSDAIQTPPLTGKEIAALQRLLPNPVVPTREEVREMGFDLEEDQIAAFVTHYLRYPTFAEIAP